MSKLSQLYKLQQLQLPVPPFQSIDYQTFLRQQGTSDLLLKYPVAVRSTFEEEDGANKSYAGHFHTALQVEEAQLKDSIQEVFQSYPYQEGQQVIVQEMIDPLLSGVLFAYRKGVWKLEVARGLGEQIVSGQINAESFLLPQFNKADRFWGKWFRFWKGCPIEDRSIEKALIDLSVSTQLLLSQSPEAPEGLDIEFSITAKGLYFLQARPITTSEEQEWVLTSANHKEILPPQPSPLMTDVISSAGEDLFDFYRGLDPSLAKQPFLVETSGMPWINLSALLGMMVHWGLPTSLVAQSVGAVDVYKVGFRWWRFLTKIPVFLRMQFQQLGIKNKIEKWAMQQEVQIRKQQQKRVLLWQDQPAEALKQTLADFRKGYIELVTYMQLLTGAMSGPVALIRRWGWLEKYALSDSASTNYFKAYQAFVQGDLDRERFLTAYGHRGFYESDIGQRRFWEYSEADWNQLKPSTKSQQKPTEQSSKKVPFLLQPIYQLIHTREWIRHQSMRFFWAYRRELLEQTKAHLGEDFDFSKYKTVDLIKSIENPKQVIRPEYPIPSGWDLNTFLSNQLGRRIQIHFNKGDQQQKQGIGIYPGKIKGQVWRVSAADFTQLKVPDYDKIILVADALDPGWIPFFTQVDGVVSYVGGLLSHASIILREAKVPSITQIPEDILLEEGDWIEIDGKTGSITNVD